jgi:hypothetical protein
MNRFMGLLMTRPTVNGTSQFKTDFEQFSALVPDTHEGLLKRSSAGALVTFGVLGFQVPQSRVPALCHHLEAFLDQHPDVTLYKHAVKFSPTEWQYAIIANIPTIVFEDNLKTAFYNHFANRTGEPLNVRFWGAARGVDVE